MAWIKRNLVLVVFGVVALGLMGFAGYFLYDNIQKNDEVILRLQTAVQDLNTLNASDPYPNEDTLAGIKKDQERVQQLLTDSRKAFAVGRKPAQLDDRSFKLLLEKTIDELKKEALAAGVGIPSEKYSFGFTSQRNELQYKPGSLEPWAIQLGEIRDICRILYRAKVMALQGVRRAPFFPFDLGGPDTMGMATATNTFATYYPYEVTFRGFSSDLAAVLEGFQKSTNCYVVKMINVDQSQIGIQPYNPALAAAMAAATNAAASGAAPRPGAPPKDAFQDRYGIKSGPQPVAPKVAAPVAVASRVTAPVAPQLTTVLAEKPLRVAMLVVVVKLKDDKEVKEVKVRDDKEKK